MPRVRLRHTAVAVIEAYAGCRLGNGRFKTVYRSNAMGQVDGCEHDRLVVWHLTREWIISASPRRGAVAVRVSG